MLVAAGPLLGGLPVMGGFAVGAVIGIGLFLGVRRILQISDGWTTSEQRWTKRGVGALVILLYVFAFFSLTPNAFGWAVVLGSAVGFIGAALFFSDLLPFVTRRALWAIPTIVVSVTLFFALFFVLPGDPVDVLVGNGNRKISQQTKDNLTERFELDKPVVVQYLHYWNNLLRGDFGTSWKNNEDVTTIVKETLPPSIRLAAWAILLEIVIGLSVGVLAAVKRYSFADVSTTVATTALVAVPIVVLGTILQYSFGIVPATQDIPGAFLAGLVFTIAGAFGVAGWKVFRHRDPTLSPKKTFYKFTGKVCKWFLILIAPVVALTFVLEWMTGAFASASSPYPSWLQLRVADYPTEGWSLFFFPNGDGWKNLILPVIVLAATTTAITARVTRTSLLEVMRSDHIRTAEAKGLSNRKVVTRHGLRNALVPVVTLIALDLGALIGSAIVTETIFSWPGIGRRSYLSITDRDTPVALGITIVLVVIYLLLSLFIDMFYAYLNPKVRSELETS